MANPPNYGVVWLVIGAVLIIVAALIFAVGSMLGPRPSVSAESSLTTDAPVCRPRSGWPELGMVLIRQSAAVPPSTIRTTVTVRAGGEEGQSITLTPFDAAKVSISEHGFYFSVATFDLRDIAPATEVCFDATGLSGRVSGDDLMLTGPLARANPTRPAWVMPVSIVTGLIAVASLARFAMIFAANKP